MLSGAAFDRLLACLDVDRDRAGMAYERLRSKLLTFFERRGNVTPEDSADETLNRVARRLDEGVRVPSAELHSYVYAVARNVLREAWKAPGKTEPIDDLPDAQQPSHDPRQTQGPDPEVRLRCLVACLERLPTETRALVAQYHTGEGRERIDRRKALTRELGIPLNALRIRVHRVRVDLEACMRTCVEGDARAKEIRDSVIP